MTGKAKEKHDYRKANGLCVKCGKPKDDSDRLQCESCRKEQSEYLKMRRKYFLNNKICPICRTTRLADGEKVCTDCSQKLKDRRESYGYGKGDMRAYNRARRERLKAQGLCVTCGREKADGGTVTCRKCKKRATELRELRKQIAEHKEVV